MTLVVGLDPLKSRKHTTMQIHHTISAAALVAALAFAGEHASAQTALPTLPSAAAPVPARDIQSHIAWLTARYGLSSEQAEKVRAILDAHEKKAEEIKQQQLAPEQASSRLKSLQEEESSWVSAVLTPEQRRRYAQDAGSRALALRASAAAR